MYDELFFFPTISYISSSSFPPPFLLFCQYYYIFIVFLVVFLKFFKFFKFFFFLFSPTFAKFRQYLLSFFLFFSYYLLFYFCHSIGNNSVHHYHPKKKEMNRFYLFNTPWWRCVPYSLVPKGKIRTVSCKSKEMSFQNTFLRDFLFFWLWILLSSSVAQTTFIPLTI